MSTKITLDQWQALIAVVDEGGYAAAAEAADLGAPSFVEATDDQQRALLDRIAYPDTAAPEDEAGVAFFSLLRNYVATGYFSSPQGVADVGYLGNVARAEWTGCPDEANAYVMREA